MNVISKKTLKEFYEKHPSTQSALEGWYRVAKRSTWKSLNDVQNVYRDAESVGNFTVFNIKGNNIRLIVLIDYKASLVLVRHVLTHAEYDKNKWKKDARFK